jgi:bacterial/archaeal transporter family protein
MSEWVTFSLATIGLWGIMGLLQKLSTNRISADAVFIWSRIGYLPILVWFLIVTSFHNLGAREYAIGIAVGVTNGLGAWYLYASLESGAPASVAIPLTSLYPLLTVLLAVAFLGERPKLLQWVGIALAMLAGHLMSLGSSSPRVEAKAESNSTPAFGSHES